MNAQTRLWVAAARFFALAECAASHGGFWVSAAGGTANAVAGELCRRCGVSFADALEVLDKAGKEFLGEGWYVALADIQPPVCDFEYRFDARTVARAACRGL
jgi:hypothetical protein